MTEKLVLDRVDVNQEIVLGHCYRFECTIYDNAINNFNWELSWKSRIYHLVIRRDNLGTTAQIKDIFDNRYRKNVKINQKEIGKLLKRNNNITACEEVLLRFLSRSLRKWPGEISID